VTYSIAFDLYELPKTQPDTFPNRFARTNYRKKWHRWVWESVLAAGGAPAAPLERAAVTCVRHSAREPDPDNLAYSFKVVLDGLKHAGVIRDDRRAVVGAPVYIWEWTKPKYGRITIGVREEPREQ